MQKFMTTIKEFILSGITITSDCWGAYNTLEEAGHINMPLNHLMNWHPHEHHLMDMTSYKGDTESVQQEIGLCVHKEVSRGSYGTILYIHDGSEQYRLEHSTGRGRC